VSSHQNKGKPANRKIDFIVANRAKKSFPRWIETRMYRSIHKPLINLLLVSVVSAALWWTEVHLRGWDGLQWLTYFHTAIPIGMVLFLGWLYFHCAIPAAPKRVAYLFAVTVFAAGAYPIINWSLCAHFRGWVPLNEWLLLLSDNEWPLMLKVSYFSILIIFPAIPMVFWSLSWCFGAKFGRFGLISGSLSYLLATPLAMLLIAVVGHRGQPDAIHAIKTGFCIPFLMVGLGLPFVFHKRKASNKPNGE
jgi:hypothetical protein